MNRTRGRIKLPPKSTTTLSPAEIRRTVAPEVSELDPDAPSPAFWLLVAGVPLALVIAVLAIAARFLNLP